MKTNSMNNPVDKTKSAETMKILSRKQSGLSLIDLLVSMLIAGTLMTGVVQVYSSQMGTARMLDDFSVLQETGRYALHVLARDIRNAGYTGCTVPASEQQVFNTLKPGSDPLIFDPSRGIVGWESIPNSNYGTAVANVTYATAVVDASATWTTSTDDPIPMTDVIMSVPGSDILRLWGTNGGGVDVESISPGANTIVTTDVDNSFEDDDILFISDCVVTAIVQACNVQDTGGGASTNLTLSAGCTPGNVAAERLPPGLENGQVFSANPVTYWIGKLNDNTANPSALFRDSGGGPVELVAGIESMQLLYGEDVDGDAGQAVDQFVSADNVEDWTNVKSVKLSILAVSTNDIILTAPKSYEFNNTTHTPTDRRARRIYSTTITLRNRIVGPTSR